MSVSSSTSLALQTYEPPARDRRVHLDDLSGVLELLVLASLVYALRSLRRKELSLAQFTHTICMLSLLFIGGHFVEEHVLGVRKLEGLLKFGFQALSEDYSTPPRSGIVNLFRGVWELSGVFVACGGVLYTRLWKCGHPECCPSCIASSSSISAGQGLAGNGCGPVHLKCRLLRARLYLPIFVMWWGIIIAVIGARFNSLLGGSAIRPANDAYYFLAVLRSSPFVGVAMIGATISVYLMAELLEAELKPQVNEMFRCLAVEMENDEIIRSLLGQQFQSGSSHGSLFGSRSVTTPGSLNQNRSIHPSENKTPVHASSYINNDKSDISNGSFFISEESLENTPMSSPSSFPINASWSAPSPNYQNPPSSFQSNQPNESSLSRSPVGSSSSSSSMNNLNQDFELKARHAEAEAFAWARQQSANQLQQHQAMDDQLSRQIRSPSPQPMDALSGGVQRGRLPPATAPMQRIGRSMSPSSGASRNRSMSPNLHRSISPSARAGGMRSPPPATTMLNNGATNGARVKVPASFSMFNRGEGDVSHLISSDSEDDEEGLGDSEDRRAHAAMIGLYDDLGSGGGGGGLKNNGVWPSSSSIPVGTSSSLLQPLSAPKGVLLARTNSGSSLTRSQSGSSLEAESAGLLPLSSPTGSASGGVSFPETPQNISMTSMNQNLSQKNSSSYSPATKQAAINAASKALHGDTLTSSGGDNAQSSLSSPLSPVNLARSAYDSPHGEAASNNSNNSNNGGGASSSILGLNSSARGRAPSRSTTSSFLSDRPVSLTRSNADSSEDSESDSESETETETETESKVNLKSRGEIGSMLKPPSSPRLSSRGPSPNQQPKNTLENKPIGSVSNQSNVLLQHKPLPPSKQPNDASLSSSVSTQSTSNDDGGKGESLLRGRSSESDNSDGSSPSSVVSLAKDGWKRFVDESSGAAYWFNENSGESSWTKPILAQS